MLSGLNVKLQEYNIHGWWVGELNGTVGIVPKDFLHPAYILVEMKQTPDQYDFSYNNTTKGFDTSSEPSRDNEDSNSCSAWLLSGAAAMTTLLVSNTLKSLFSVKSPAATVEFRTSSFSTVQPFMCRSKMVLQRETSSGDVFTKPFASWSESSASSYTLSSSSSSSLTLTMLPLEDGSEWLSLSSASFWSTC
ncbi:hypothetical protein INR49_005836 [Caranx melampygus]|nr:hypothetical protein INR49_005836 [Caranx melampygus]